MKPKLPITKILVYQVIDNVSEEILDASLDEFYLLYLIFSVNEIINEIPDYKVQGRGFFFKSFKSQQ